MSLKNSVMVQAILRAVRKQHPKATAHTREDIAPDLLKQIKAEATAKERKRHLASHFLGKAFAALKPQSSLR